jgi:3-hydroxymyristoyl/3-hydroxydecanoyl-(acyl carrier protein) dehydratase
VPPCLLVEAVGQLAAYVSMHWSGFTSRPVAATAGEVRILSEAIPDCDLDLEIEITSAKRAAIGYRGRAAQRGRPVVVLERAVGALLPMAEFDDPARVARELEVLRGTGLPPRATSFAAAMRPRARTLERSANRVRAEIATPSVDPLYADHFPRRPVYPATLLLDAQIALASELLRSVQHVKVRSFVPPGRRLEVAVERLPAPSGRDAVALLATDGPVRVSSATAEFILD